MALINAAEAVAGGVKVLPRFGERAALIGMQRGAALDKVAKVASELGISSPEVLGAQAMLGTKNLAKVVAERGSGAIDEAVAGAAKVARRDVALISNGEPLANGSLSNLARELEARGASPRFLDARRMKVEDGRLLYRGPDAGDAYREIAMPEAAIGRNVSAKRLAPLEEAGVHFANLPHTRPLTLSKSMQAEVFAARGVSHPATHQNLSSLDEVRAAAHEVGFPAVVKENNGHGGTGVWIVKNDDELSRVAAKHFPEPKQDSLLVQEFVDVGAADERFTVVRGVDGKPRLGAVHHRQGNGTDGLANGPEGSTYTRVALRDVDASTRKLAEDAVEAAGLDYAGVDVVTAANGKRYVLEVNGTPGVPEHDVPLPRAEHTLPALADWLVYGTRGA